MQPLSVYISTGMSSIEEVSAAVNIYKRQIITDSNGMYVKLPLPEENAMTSTMLQYKDMYENISIGYSDHTVGNSAAIAASLLGADT